MSEEEIYKMLNNFPQIEVVNYILKIQNGNERLSNLVNKASELLIKKDNKIEQLQKKEALIKYLEDKINEPRIGGCDCLTDKMFETEKRVYQDILERVKSGKYE